MFGSISIKIMLGASQLPIWKGAIGPYGFSNQILAF